MTRLQSATGCVKKIAIELDCKFANWKINVVLPVTTTSHDDRHQCVILVLKNKWTPSMSTRSLASKGKRTTTCVSQRTSHVSKQPLTGACPKDRTTPTPATTDRLSRFGRRLHGLEHCRRFRSRLEAITTFLLGVRGTAVHLHLENS